MAVQPWEALLGAGLAVVLVVWWWPRMRRGMADAPRADAAMWRGALLPLAAVVAFVVLLIASL